MNKMAIISLIDDDVVYQFLTKKIIEETGKVETILQFTEAQDAIDYLCLHHQDIEKLPDLILLDLEMPFMDGWQFLQEYNQITFAKDITIYIVSSSTSAADKDRSERIDEVKGFIIKPISKETFMEVFSRA